MGQLAHPIYSEVSPDMLRRYHVQVRMIATGDEAAGPTGTTRPRDHAFMFTEKRRSEAARQRRLAHARRPSEEIGMGDAIGDHRTLERLHGPLMPHYVPMIVFVSVRIHHLQNSGEGGIIASAVGG
jgi:hypothetical protein